MSSSGGNRKRELGLDKPTDQGPSNEGSLGSYLVICTPIAPTLGTYLAGNRKRVPNV